MKKVARAMLVLVSIAALDSSRLMAQDIWATADSATVRLAPSRFPALPADIRKDLEGRGCRIPQLAEDLNERGPHNVIRGALTEPGRVEWAVLCSVRDTSRILIYLNGAAPAADSLATKPDRMNLQTLTGGRPGYSRLIRVADARYIRRMAAASAGPPPPRVMDHVGIEDYFVDKASVIFYFDRGGWLQLRGADDSR